MTCCLISSRGKPCIDAVPIPAATNEMGLFRQVLSGLENAYGDLDLYRLVSADAGMCSEENGRVVVRDFQRHYLFGLKDNQPTLRAEAERLLARRTSAQAYAETVDVVGKHTVTRRVYLTDEMASFLDWTHLSTTLRIESVKEDLDTGAVLESENRYYVSSLPLPRMSADQWLFVVRCHWAVENTCHNTFDTAFAEDDRPWITAHPKGMVNVLLLRRIAFNIVTLFRSVTQRSEERRLAPWKDLLRWFYNAMIGDRRGSGRSAHAQDGCCSNRLNAGLRSYAPSSDRRHTRPSMARQPRRVQARPRSPVYPVPVSGARRPTGRRAPPRGPRAFDPACGPCLSP